MNISIRRLAASAAVAATLVLGVGASSASATPFISTDPRRHRHRQQRLHSSTVTGHIEMSQADAQAACAHTGDPVDVELYGQDAGITFADDLLIPKSSWAARHHELHHRLDRPELLGLPHP